MGFLSEPSIRYAKAYLVFPQTLVLTPNCTGYKGYEPFGPGLLQAPQQPRSALLDFNIDERIRTIEKWTLNCLESHVQCQSGGFTPRRLLHVGVNNINIVEDPIRLIEARSGSYEPFIALSHCWGKIQHATTTTANYRQRLTSIPMHELSKTFQDAVWLTRRLEIKYLWIDSLCILQDDVDDWNREAATMSRLYGAAYLTIAASHGVDGSAGILYEGTVRPRVLDVEQRDANGRIAVATVVLIPRVRYSESSPAHQLYGSNEEIINPSFTDDGLLSRAWAFQERALSTRIVHFTKEELVWECKQKRQCECGGINGASFITSLVGSIRRRSKLSDSDEDEDDDDSVSSSVKTDQYDAPKKAVGPGIDNFKSNYSIYSEPERIWWIFVEYYTTRKLTNPEDRGAAFSGIAKIFGGIMREWGEVVGEYCAGIWEDHLPESLLWTCSTGENKSYTTTRIKSIAEPSWSWYSVNGPCRLVKSLYELPSIPQYVKQHAFLTQLFSLMLEFHEFGDQLGDTSYDPRQKAITVSCWPSVVATRTSAADTFTLKARHGVHLSRSISIGLLADDPEDQHFAGDITCLNLASGGHTEFIIDDEKSSGPAIDYMKQLYPWQIDPTDPGLTNLHYSHHECNEHVVGLALVPVPGEERTYRRIGLFHAKGDCLGISYNKNSGRKMASSELPLPSSFFRDWNHSIDIEGSITLI